MYTDRRDIVISESSGTLDDQIVHANYGHISYYSVILVQFAFLLSARIQVFPDRLGNDPNPQHETLAVIIKYYRALYILSIL